MQFALTSLSSKVSVSDLGALLDTFIQYNQDVADGWSVPMWATGVYNDLESLPTDDTIPSTVLDSLSDPQAAAYHTLIGDRPVIECLPDEVPEAMAHEFGETRIDVDCDQWATRPDGTQIAKEICDPFQGHDGYVINGHRMACFALPSFFDANGTAPFCKCGKATAPFVVDPGGYAVIIDASGNETQVFARLEYGKDGHFAAALKLAKRNSRLMRRLRGRRK